MTTVKALKKLLRPKKNVYTWLPYAFSLLFWFAVTTYGIVLVKHAKNGRIETAQALLFLDLEYISLACILITGATLLMSGAQVAHLDPLDQQMVQENDVIEVLKKEPSVVLKRLSERLLLQTEIYKFETENLAITVAVLVSLFSASLLITQKLWQGLSLSGNQNYGFYLYVVLSIFVILLTVLFVNVVLVRDRVISRRLAWAVAQAFAISLEEDS